MVSQIDNSRRSFGASSAQSPQSHVLGGHRSFDRVATQTAAISARARPQQAVEHGRMCTLSRIGKGIPSAPITSEKRGVYVSRLRLAHSSNLNHQYQSVGSLCTTTTVPAPPRRDRCTEELARMPSQHYEATTTILRLHASVRPRPTGLRPVPTDTTPAASSTCYDMQHTPLFSIASKKMTSSRKAEG